MSQVRRLDQIPAAQVVDRSDQIAIWQDGRTRTAALADLVDGPIATAVKQGADALTAALAANASSNAATVAAIQAVSDANTQANALKLDKTGDGSLVTVKSAPAALARKLSDSLGNVLYLRDYAADDGTPVTAAVQAVVTAAATSGRTVYVSRSQSGTGRYAIGSVAFGKAILEIEEGAGFTNLDGTPYTGPGFLGVGVLPGRFSPYQFQDGARVSSPRFTFQVVDKSTTQNENTVIADYVDAYPYAVTGQIRNFMLMGQNSASAGSLASATLYQNVYNVSNGLGVIIQADATNGSQFLTNCSPSPTAVNSASSVGAANVFHPARITSATAGLADNVFAESWDAGTIALGSGPNGTPIAWNGPTGRYSFRVVSGRSEFNPISLAITCFGTAQTGGAQGGMNFYNEITTRTAAGSNAVDQEGLGNGLCVSLTKQAPGNLRTRLHGGTAALNVSLRPDDQFFTNKSYACDDGIVVAGWSEPTSVNLPSGSNAAAGYGAFNGLRIGGARTAPYQKRGERSRFQVGALIQDYDVAISINTPNTQGTFSGDAVRVADGAGSISVGDFIVERRSQPPASATAVGTVGQRAWDANYEYRCVATNTWKRTPLSTW